MGYDALADALLVFAGYLLLGHGSLLAILGDSLYRFSRFQNLRYIQRLITPAHNASLPAYPIGFWSTMRFQKVYPMEI